MDKSIIPQCWNAEDALIVCAFLENLISAIWQTHGREMAIHLQRVRLLGDTAPPDCTDPAYKDELPF